MLKNIELERLEAHWAVSSIPQDVRKNCFDQLRKRHVCDAVGNSIEFSCHYDENFNETLAKLAMAYEIPAIENISSFTNYADDSCDREIFVAAAWRCFDLYSNLEILEEFNQKVFWVIRICSMAYCAERWNDLRKWYLDNMKKLFDGSKDSIADLWDSKILKTIYRCWLRLFVKKDWDDLSKIATEIIMLRQLQNHYEKEYFESSSDSRYSALILISFYHLAKATELLATYMMQGNPLSIHSQLDKHFENAIESAICSNDVELETFLRWLHCASKQMVDNSIWWIAKAINSRTTDFVKYVTKNRGLFEMLPPQKAAIREQGLLDQAATSIAVEMPTSGGKTLLAEFKMLQALNQFDQEKGWVAYVAPTKALTSQITRRLRKDFGEKIKVEKLSAAVEIDAYEDELLSSDERSFDILVATPEKMNLVIKNGTISRPLALIVMDEAHNIEDNERGLRIELLLATVKTDCERANFLLLMPYVENAESLSRWLSNDLTSGKSISIGSTPWKPSERIVGIFDKCRSEVKGAWHLEYESLLTMADTITFNGKYRVKGNKHFGVAYSSVSKTVMTAAMAKELSQNGTCLAIGRTTECSWSMARMLTQEMSKLTSEFKGYENIELVKKYLADEMGSEFELIGMLDKGIGVHNAGLPDDVKTLMEWLAEEECLKVLCATTTIAQGINFPVSSVLLQSISLPSKGYSKDMTPREFWNLVGRTGRIGQNNFGLVGLACEPADKEKLIKFVSEKTGALVSRLVALINEIEARGELYNLEKYIYKEEWTDFRCYIAHLCNEKEKLDDILSDMEQLLRNTLGYNSIKLGQNGYKKSKIFLDATKKYASQLQQQPQICRLADETGFSPEGVKKAFKAIGDLDKKLTSDSLKISSIFGGTNVLSDMYGIMLKIPQLNQLQDIAGKGDKHNNIANITTDWVSGCSIYDIAKKYFSGEDTTKSLMIASKAINKQIANAGTWGLSAITKLSGIDFEQLTEEQKKEIDALPAMIYHGVRTPEAVLMCINSVPRSISENMGREFKKIATEYTVQEAKKFICSLNENDWEKFKKPSSHMSGKDYMSVWKLFSGY